MSYNPLFPYFGGKSKIAPEVWARFGDVSNYIEPFSGSAAMLMLRPEKHTRKIETINDFSGLVSNFWRSVKNDPEGVAKWADYPVIEKVLHARHYWLVSEGQRILDSNLADSEFYDTKIAGYWLWGMGAFIGGGFGSGEGSWKCQDGEWVKKKSGRSRC